MQVRIRAYLATKNIMHKSQQLRHPAIHIAAAWLLATASALVAHAQDGTPLADGSSDVVQTSYGGGLISGAGATYSQALDSVLRVRYNTTSYGQDEGNLDIGSFKSFIWNDDTMFFADGQVTLSDEQGVGFNVGGGVRYVSETIFTPDPIRVTGASIWADGTSTAAENFFPQIGLSWESLGDLVDFRFNAGIPLGDRTQTGRTVASGDDPVFLGNNLAIPTLTPLDTAFYNADFESAVRMGDREAWGFGGGYYLYDSDRDTFGSKLGVRGYAVPDVLVQFAVTHDDIFKTNAVFSLTWFVGRTRTDHCATGSAYDRVREPVLRNDYVAIHTEQIAGGITAVNDDGDELRIVHVNSAAGAGGDGTFENPLDNIDDIFANSMEDDIVFAHADSVFTGQNAVLQENQRFLGEGEGIEHMVTTNIDGATTTVILPESSIGSADATKPTIASSVGSAITLADNNEVSNFLIDGNGITTTAIDGLGGGAGVTDPNLNNLMIQETTGDGITLLAGARVDTEDDDDDGDDTELRIPFAVTIDEVMFDQVAGADIRIDAQADDGMPVDPDDNDVDLVGDMTISNITSTNNQTTGLIVTNMNEADTFGKLTVTGYDYTGDGVTSVGAMAFENISAEVTLNDVTAEGGIGAAMAFTTFDEDGIINISGFDYDGGTLASSGLVFTDVNSDTGTNNGVTVINSTFTGGMGPGVSIRGDAADVEGIYSFNATNSFENVGDDMNNAFEVLGDFGLGAPVTEFTGQLTMGADIDNDAGQSVAIANVGTDGSLTFTGDINDTGAGITIDDSTGGDITFTGDLTIDTSVAGTEAIALTNNTGAEIGINGTVDLTTDGATGFLATGGGTLTMLNSNNDSSITTQDATAIDIQDMTIDTGGVEFSQVTRNDAGASGTAINVIDSDGGTVRIGDPGAGGADGDGGSLAVGGADHGVVIANSSVELNNVEISHAGGATGTGVMVTDTNADDMIVTLNNVDITDASTGISVDGTGGTGTLLLIADGGTIEDSLVTGIDFNNITSGNLSVNDTLIDGGGVTATAGVSIMNSDATFTFDADTEIMATDGTAFQIGMAGTNNSGGAPTITMNGDINETDGIGRGIHIAELSGGDVQLLGDYAINSGADNAVEIDSNQGNADVWISNLDIDTSTGIGVLATDNLSAEVGIASSSITTTNGVALQVTDTNIDATGAQQGMQFDSITATNTAGSTIVMDNVTGGAATLGSTGTTSTLDATGAEAVVLTNVANVSLVNTDIVDSDGTAAVDINNTNTAAMAVTLDDVTITNSADDGVNALSNNSGDFGLTIANSNIGGVTNDALQVTTSGGSDVQLTLTDSVFDDNLVVDINNSGTFDMLFRNSEVETTNNEVAFELDLDTNVTVANIRFDTTGGGTSSITGVDATAFDFDATGVSTVNFLFEDITVTNNSASTAATFNADDNTILNLTLTENIFNNPGGQALDVESAGTAVLTLNMNDNTANSPSGNLNLIETAGTFRVQDLADVDANNPGGTVTFTPNMGAFTDFAGEVPTPPNP